MRMKWSRGQRKGNGLSSTRTSLIAGAGAGAGALLLSRMQDRHCSSTTKLQRDEVRTDLLWPKSPPPILLGRPPAPYSCVGPLSFTNNARQLGWTAVSH